MKKSSLLLMAVAATFTLNATASPDSISYKKQWTFKHTIPGQISEIPAFDAKTNTIWVAGVVGVDVLNAESGQIIKHIDVTPYGFVNSVAIHNGVAAFAVEAKTDRRIPGSVVFFDTKTLLPSEGVNQVIVGSLPDMLTFTHDGSKLLVANEATPNAVADTAYTTTDPEGSVSIIDMASRNVLATAGFSGVALSGQNLRTNIGIDLEPEYIAINNEGTKAFVTVQEANGVAVLDLTTNQFTNVIGLGVKDFSLANNFIDPNDQDSQIGNLRPIPVKGLYQPDNIVTHQYRGQTYLVMANEGDTREDELDKRRISQVSELDASVTDDLDRLSIATTDSTPGNIVTFGGRSFSIRNEAGNLIYDSGNLLDAEAVKRGIYDDGRSDDKGVEPEGVTLLDIGGRTYAFVGLERTLKSAVAIFDITNPNQVSFIDMIVTPGDRAPEGLSAYHYRGNFYLCIANEVSNTTTLYLLDRIK